MDLEYYCDFWFICTGRRKILFWRLNDRYRTLLNCGHAIRIIVKSMETALDRELVRILIKGRLLRPILRLSFRKLMALPGARNRPSLRDSQQRNRVQKALGRLDPDFRREDEMGIGPDWIPTFVGKTKWASGPTGSRLSSGRRNRHSKPRHM